MCKSKSQKLPILFPEKLEILFSGISNIEMAIGVSNTSGTPPELLQGGPGWPSGTSPWLPSSLAGIVAGWSAWQYVMTLLLGLVVYDQGKPPLLALPEAN